MRVRIALAASEDGHWCAAGGGGNDDLQNMEDCRDNCRIRGTGSISCYWIEVDVAEPFATRTVAVAAQTTSEYDDRQNAAMNCYTEGKRRALLGMLRHVLRELGVEEDTEVGKSGWVIERQEAVAQLRGLCEEYGDNDWPDDLALCDVISKHLGNYLEEKDGDA